MSETTSVRIDKWLWAVRLFKTRSLAAEACKKGHVKIGEHAVKPSRDVHIGEIIIAKTGDITRTSKVLGLIERRVGAQLAKDFFEDQTPASEYEKQREQKFLPPVFSRPKGAGRPTKKDRRDIEKYF